MIGRTQLARPASLILRLPDAAAAMLFPSAILNTLDRKEVSAKVSKGNKWFSVRVPSLLALAAAVLGVVVSVNRLRAEVVAGCVDYACTSSTSCRNHSCDICWRDNRCALNP